MFGGQVIAPSNSPHLRKSGSRPVVFESGGDQGNGAVEDFSHSSGVDDQKSGITPLSTVAVMPSPICLWRFKVLLFFLWGFICCKIEWYSVMRMSVRSILVLQSSTSCDYDGLALGG